MMSKGPSVIPAAANGRSAVEPPSRSGSPVGSVSSRPRSISMGRSLGAHARAWAVSKRSPAGATEGGVEVRRGGGGGLKVTIEDDDRHLEGELKPRLHGVLQAERRLAEPARRGANVVEQDIDLTGDAGSDRDEIGRAAGRE